MPLDLVRRGPVADSDGRGRTDSNLLQGFARQLANAVVFVVQCLDQTLNDVLCLDPNSSESLGAGRANAPILVPQKTTLIGRASLAAGPIPPKA